jgi:hypothetical protein
MPPHTTTATRRNFIRLAALTPLGAAASSHAQMPIQRSGGSLLKPALNAYSFLELLTENMKYASRGIDLFGVCDFCAKHNIEAVDLCPEFTIGLATFSPH